MNDTRRSMKECLIEAMCYNGDAEHLEIIRELEYRPTQEIIAGMLTRNAFLENSLAWLGYLCHVSSEKECENGSLIVFNKEQRLQQHLVHYL